MYYTNILKPLKPVAAGVLLFSLFACGATEQRLVSPEGEVKDWSTYYTSQEAHQIMEEFAGQYPELTNLQKIGESFQGRDLMVMEVSNMENKPPKEKPGFYLDGSVHSEELTGYMVSLYFMDYLLSNYGEDPEVTELLDTRAFYINTLFNPDGVDKVLAEDQHVRSTLRPVDSNEDGTPDSDPPEDLNDDGRILEMRVPDSEGDWKKSDEDPRIMIEREDGDTEEDGPFYRLVTEGVDRNGDGEINNDPLGGLDMNRNFPRNWERWHKQPGGGDFPLSEPETNAVAHFVNDHRNINFIICGHTAGMNGGFVYRLPSAMSPRNFDSNDEALVKEFGQHYTDYTEIDRPIVPSADDPVEHRYGTLIQFGYSDFGAIGYVPEYSPPPEHWVPDSDEDGEVTKADWHRYNEEEFGGRYFSDWKSYDHPQLGEVEIGGWWTHYWGQNPPHDLLEEELQTQVPWLLYLAKKTPKVEIAESEVTQVEDDQYEVDVTVTNTGYLPTHVTEQGYEGRENEDGLEAQVVRPPLATFNMEGGSVEEVNVGTLKAQSEGGVRLRLPHLAGSNPHTESVTDSSYALKLTVRKTDPEASMELTVSTEKAGTEREHLSLE